MRYASLDLALRTLSRLDLTKQRSNELKSYLKKRGYNLSFLNQEVARVHNITRTQAPTPKDTPTINQPQRVPLVITYNPALRYISSVINKHFNILSSFSRCTNVCKAKPFVTFRRSDNLSTLIYTSELILCSSICVHIVLRGTTFISNILVSVKLHEPSTTARDHDLMARITEYNVSFQEDQLLRRKVLNITESKTKRPPFFLPHKNLKKTSTKRNMPTTRDRAGCSRSRNKSRRQRFWQ